jgi:hypothetical protein
MEHRYSDRLSANLNIVIYKKNLLVAMGVVKNMGSEGVFIESGFADLSANQPLEIEFLASDKSASDKSMYGNRFKAVVVHRTEMGFGVEIEDVAARVKLASLVTPRTLSRNRNRPAAGIGYATL